MSDHDEAVLSAKIALDEIEEGLDSCEMTDEDGDTLPIVPIEHWQTCIARVRAALEQRQVPEGWKLVPLWPTRAMCEAMQWQIGGTKEQPIKTWGSIESVYGAALAAAPSPDQTVRSALEQRRAGITEKQLTHALNVLSVDAATNTPDYVLARELFAAAPDPDRESGGDDEV